MGTRPGLLRITSLFFLVLSSCSPSRASILTDKFPSRNGITNRIGEPSSVIRAGDWKLIHFYEDGREELYNLSTDPGETSDDAKEHPKIIADLKTKLFNYLDETLARFPRKDPEYRQELEQKYLEGIANKLLPKLEQQRRDFHSLDFDPGNEWWVSENVNEFTQ